MSENAAAVDSVSGSGPGVVLMGMSATTARAIRSDLKAKGYGPRDVSVRNDSYSMGSTVRVRVRRADIRLGEIEQLARKHERVSRDDSGEILGGGNTYVDVEYADEALAPAVEPLRALLAEGRLPNCSLVMVRDDSDADQVTVSHRGTGAVACRISRQYGAERLARLLAASGELAAVLAARPLTEAELAAMPAPAPELPPQAPARATAAELALIPLGDREPPPSSSARRRPAPIWRSNAYDRQATKVDLVDIGIALGLHVTDRMSVPEIRAAIQAHLSAQ